MARRPLKNILVLDILSLASFPNKNLVIDSIDENNLR